MVDGELVKKYDNKKDAEQHAAKLNQQIMFYGKEAYVEDER